MRQLLLAVLVLAFAAVAHAADSDYPWREAGYIPVANGTPQATTLMYQVMFPDPAVWGPGPYPTVIDYSGYLPATSIYDGLDDRFLAAGYAVAGINMRGSHGSGGTFDYFHPQQAKDGYDAIEWLAARPWSNGRFGMVGKSWPGISQLYVAAERPPHLKAIVPGHVFSDLYRDVAFPGGVMNVTFDSYWSVSRVYEGYLTGPLHYFETNDEQALLNQLGHLPNILLNPVVRILTHQYDDSFFHERSNWYRLDQIDIPVMLVQSWQDEQVGGRAAQLVEQLAPGVPWRLVGTNGDHAEYYGPDVFPHILRFLSYHLKERIPDGEQRTVTEPLLLPNGKLHPWRTVTRPETYQEALARYNAEDPVTVVWENGAAGDRRGAWTESYSDWPPPNQTPYRLYLRADGTLSETSYANPPGAWLLGLLLPKQLGAVDYKYIPFVGTQERGGYGIEAPFVDVEAVPPASWDTRPPQGAFAQFTSAPLAADKVMLGTGSIDLTISSTAVDTDFEVTLSEVRPDGYEVFVQQGWLRASHRREDTALSTPLRPYHTHRLTDASLLIAGEPTTVRIELFPFAHVFRQGSRIRIAVTAPHTHPDLWGFAPLPLPALNTIYTSKPFPSSVALPVLAGDTAPTPLPAPGSLRNQPARPEAASTTVAPALPLATDAYSAAWLDNVEWLSSVGANIASLDAAGVTSLLYPTLADWSAAAGYAAPAPADNPNAVTPQVRLDWLNYVAQTAFDPAQPDDWFVQWFEDWYAAMDPPDSP
jgi:predicted acyl esterase